MIKKLFYKIIFSRFFFIVLFFLFSPSFVLIGGCIEDKTNMLMDIMLLEKPIAPREYINIDNVLKKHIYIGMPEKNVLKLLKDNEFSLIEEEAFQAGIKKKHWVYHLSKPPSSFISYKISISITVADQKISEFSGVYIKQML